MGESLCLPEDRGNNARVYCLVQGVEFMKGVSEEPLSLLQFVDEEKGSSEAQLLERLLRIIQTNDSTVESLKGREMSAMKAVTEVFVDWARSLGQHLRGLLSSGELAMRGDQFHRRRPDSPPSLPLTTKENK